MSDDYAWVARAIAWLEEHRDHQPTLEALSEEIGASPFHLQRVFKRWAGISPKRFLQLLSLEDAKRSLRQGASVLDAALAAGLSGPSRLHDHFVAIEAMTPGEWSRDGADLKLHWGRFDSPFGTCAIAWSERGICALEFESDAALASRGAPERWMRTWSAANWIEDSSGAQQLGLRIFEPSGTMPLRLWVKGTNFQVQVWRALLLLPPGSAASYGDLARHIGAPHAARAVGTAVGANPVAFLIPCHRILRASGALGGYRWDPQRKRALLAWEAAREAEDVGSSSG